MSPREFHPPSAGPAKCKNMDTPRQLETRRRGRRAWQTTRQQRVKLSGWSPARGPGKPTSQTLLTERRMPTTPERRTQLPAPRRPREAGLRTTCSAPGR